MRSHYCGHVDEKLSGQEVSVAGWVHRRRDHGGVIFVDLRDREGLLQIVFDPDAAEIFKEAERLRSEFVIRVKGRVRERPAGLGAGRAGTGCPASGAPGLSLARVTYPRARKSAAARAGRAAGPRPVSLVAAPSWPP